MTQPLHHALPAPAPRGFLAALMVALRRHHRRRIIAALDAAQRKDAGITWELAGYGRGADVSMLARTNLQAQR